MVIGLLTLTAIPTVTGVGQAVSAQKRQNAASKEQEKFHLTAVVEHHDGTEEPAGTCILKDGKLMLQGPGQAVAGGHKFCGFYFKYPSEEQHLGLVSSVADGQPTLNWIYVNRDTRAVEHGTRKSTVGQIVGPWGWAEDERFLTLAGDPGGFVAVQEEPDGAAERWSVFWGRGGDSKEQGKGSQRDLRRVKLFRKPLLGMESSYVRDGGQ